MRIKRWLVTGVYWLNVISIGFLTIAHIGSSWGIILGGNMAWLGEILAGLVVFIAAAAHQSDRLYIFHFGQKPRLFPRSLTEYLEKQGQSATVARDAFGPAYIRTAPITMPHAPRWLVRLAVILMVAWLPYNILNGWFCLITSMTSTEAGLTRFGTAWISFLFFRSLPILYSWHRELVLEPEK